jgi:hypothetical protein
MGWNKVEHLPESGRNIGDLRGWNKVEQGGTFVPWNTGTPEQQPYRVVPFVPPPEREKDFSAAGPASGGPANIEENEHDEQDDGGRAYRRD